MHNEKIMARFEAWWSENMNLEVIDLTRFEGGGYACHETNRAWMVWQGASDQVRDVQEFGAVGDGVTDDSPAFQAAINWATGRRMRPDGYHILGDRHTNDNGKSWWYCVEAGTPGKWKKIGSSNHPDDFAVDQFGAAMKEKMAVSRLKGRSGWNDPLLCTASFLRRLLVKAVRKGDPVDVANFAMMLHARGATTMLPSLNDDIDKQIAVVDAQRHQRLERRLKNVPVELEKRAGYDRRAMPAK